MTIHSFYTKDDNCIQITVFYKRNNFLWIGKISQNNKNIIKELRKHVYFGEYEAAFDKFELKQITIEGVKCYIPDDCPHFIGQISSSKFIECDFKFAKHFSKIYEQNLFDSTSMDSRVKQALLALKQFLKKLLIPFYISSGTLLGWYRQCGVIPYTSDVDTATWALYASRHLTQQFIHNKTGLKLTYIYGLVENGYQYTFLSETRLRFDLFFTYKEGDNLTYTGHIPSKKAYFRYIYPNFTLCSAELVGLKVLVPCEPIAVIKAGFIAFNKRNSNLFQSIKYFNYRIWWELV